MEEEKTAGLRVAGCMKGVVMHALRVLPSLFSLLLLIPLPSSLIVTMQKGLNITKEQWKLLRGNLQNITSALK